MDRIENQIYTKNKMIIYTPEQAPQKSLEWLTIRSKCLVTASDAGPYLIKTDKVSVAARRKRILRFLCGDCYRYGDPFLTDLKAKEQKGMEYNIPVQRGNHYEAEAITSLAEIIGREITPVGIITTDDGLFGASPDGVVGEDAGVECKVPLPETHLSYLLEHAETGEMISDYLYQVHFNLAISGRKVWHFYSHSVKRAEDAPEWVEHPPLHIEVRWDSLTEQIIAGMDAMRQEFREIRGKLAHMRQSAFAGTAEGEP